MAAYYKVDVSLNTNAVEVGLPSPQTVNVTIPLVGPAGPQGPAGSGGGGDVESVNGQTGVVVLAAADVGAASTSHTHGNLTNAGAIGTTANLPVKTGTSGVLEAGAFGTSAGQFAEGNDTRIATIASGSITTADGGGSIDTRGTGSIGLGVTGTRTTLTGTATANRSLSLPNASGTLALSPAETYYNITATSIGSPQQIDLSASPFTEATEVRAVLNNDTGIVYVQIFLPIDSVSIVPKFRFYHQIGGLGDITYIQLIRENDVVFPASGSGYEELNNGETLEVVWNGTAYGLTPNAPFMRRITLPNASGTLARTEDFAAPPAIGNTTPAAGTFTTLTANTSLTLNGTGAAELINAGAAAGPLRIYNTFTSATNHERGFLKWSSNVFQIGTEKGSGSPGGTARNIEFQTDGTTRWIIDSTGRLYPQGSTSQGGFFTSGGTWTFRQGSTNHFSFLNGDPTVRSGGFFQWSGTTDSSNFSNDWLRLSRPSGGALMLSANTTTTHRFLFGGDTNSFPAIKRDSTAIHIRLADDTAFAPLSCGALTLNGNLDASTRDIVTDITTGTKIGTATTQKIGFFNATPVVQQAAVADATDAASTQARLNDLLARLRTLGLIAT